MALKPTALIVVKILGLIVLLLNNICVTSMSII
jgi:hypothetical protein